VKIYCPGVAIYGFFSLASLAFHYKQNLNRNISPKHAKNYFNLNRKHFSAFGTSAAVRGWCAPPLPGTACETIPQVYVLSRSYFDFCENLGFFSHFNAQTLL